MQNKLFFVLVSMIMGVGLGASTGERILYGLDRIGRVITAHNRNIPYNHLHLAVQAGDINKVLQYILEGYDVNGRTCTPFKETPLHTAVICGHVEIAYLLCICGASNQYTLKGHDLTPSELAIMKHNLDLADMIQKITSDQSTPADKARKSGYDELGDVLDDLAQREAAKVTFNQIGKIALKRNYK